MKIKSLRLCGSHATKSVFFHKEAPNLSIMTMSFTLVLLFPFFSHIKLWLGLLLTLFIQDTIKQ